MSRISGMRPLLATMAMLLAPSAWATACCPYAIPCFACINTTLPAIESATQASFEGLRGAQNTLDQAIEAGLKAETVAIDWYEDLIVSAIMADANAVSSEIARASIAEEKMLNVLKDRAAQIDQTDLISRQNLYAATQFGEQNVGHMAKALASTQRVKMVGEDGELTDTDTTVDVMLNLVAERERMFLGGILPAEGEVTNVDALTMSSIYQSSIDGKSWDSVIAEGDWVEAVAARRFLISPPGIQANLRAADEYRSTESGYWRIASRVKAAGEFLSWDLALRSEIATEDGATSLLNFIREMVDYGYTSTSAVVDDGTAYERELLQSLTTNLAIGNLLDMLLMEVGRYQISIEAARIGFMTEDVYSPHYGYGDKQFILETSIKKGD